MAFILQVQFTGLCMFVVHPERGDVAVLLPDARFKDDEELIHRDGKPAVPHVGYLRMNLADLAGLHADAVAPPAALQLPPKDPPVVGEEDAPARFAGDIDPSPPFEVVSRFEGQTMSFGLEDHSPVDVHASVPDFDDIAPTLLLRDDLFAARAMAGERLPLLRTSLTGGSLETRGDVDEFWSIDRRLHPADKSPCIRDFRGEVLWRRPIDADSLTITLTRHGGGEPTRITLRPANEDKVLRLKIANLCADNPLEWSELLLRSAGVEDTDFKWMYSLLQPPKEKTWDCLLSGYLLPAPRIVKEKGAGFGWPRTDCAGGKVTAAFPPIDAWG